jgi:hypothetical protein
MTSNVIALVRPHAPAQPTQGETTHPEALRLRQSTETQADCTCATSPKNSGEHIRLHGLASNALGMAASLLSRTDTTPAQLQQATARAVRAATLLKRLSAMNAEVAA